MEHKFKNKKLIILVAILIVGIGASLAYFVSQVILSGSGGVVTGTTATIENTTLNVEGTLEFSDTNVYPGHEALSVVKVTASGSGSLIYNLVWTGTNELTTPLNYKVYKSTELIDASVTCDKKKEVVNGSYMLYEECTHNNFDSLSGVVASGTITSLDVETTYQLITMEEIDASTTNTVYYYFVLEYPNLNEAQNYDIGKNFNGVLNISVLGEKTKPVVNINLASSTSKDNDWYSEVTLKGEATSTIYDIDTISYCITTNDTCDPNITSNDTSVEVTLASNSKEQRVCFQATDTRGDTSLVNCSSPYKIDKSTTTTTITLNTSTSGTNNWYKAVNLAITGNNEYSGINSISYCITSLSECTPSINVTGTSTTVDLESNASAQKVCANTTDNSGSTSATACSSSYNVDNLNPSIELSIASSTLGENDWYKEVSIKGTGSDNESGVSLIKYCTTTSSSCTPTTEVSATSTTVSLESNSSAQVICMASVDAAGNTSDTKCSEAYKVDKDAPVINSITKTSDEQTSITISVDVTDTNGIATYYYQLDSNSVESSTSNTHTFDGLTAGTTYTIKVYVKDNAGNTSSTTSQSFSTKAKPISETILANNTISTRSSFSSVYTTDTAGKIFSATDDDGTTYYFAGSNPSNWVKFANMYWRIIRINGDGTIRMIYNGTSTTTTGTGTQISTSAYNSSYNNNAYVGYKYSTGSVHGTGTDSTIKKAIDSWYESNLKTNYASYIDTNAGFCNDRYPSTSTSSSNGSGGTGTTKTYYAAYIRLHTNKSPSFKCQTSSDLFTLSGASKGNKVLTYPIGLITADEVAYAGGEYETNNTSYWLYTGQNYWTMSPYTFSSTQNAYMFLVNSSGYFGFPNVNSSYGLRPVINLKSDVQLTGSGTSSDPYVVKTS